MKSYFEVGKLPLGFLEELISQAPILDRRILLGPGVGLDCAVIEHGEMLLVFKSDPITFATDQIGWYAVQVNANDIATTGATPRWMLLTALLPEEGANAEHTRLIFDQVYRACREIGVSLVGGHTEVTYGLSRPILMATMIGEVERDRLVTPRGASPGDRILLTKGIPIEATALIAREFPDRLAGVVSLEEISQAREYLHQPGISVVKDARIALEVGGVTAMHDPTEGGLAAALWEMALACGCSFEIDPAVVPISELSQRICNALGLDPLGAISSGALLITVQADRAQEVARRLEANGIVCVEIGYVGAPPAGVWQLTGHGRWVLPRPERDEVAHLYEKSS